ncbi:MAG TPA: hypothetical protein PL072_11725, partial [Phycisphaerales bacterium]|nr:hypothetical protein [Phycisphaerales bacterium]
GKNADPAGGARVEERRVRFLGWSRFAAARGVAGASDIGAFVGPGAQESHQVNPTVGWADSGYRGIPAAMPVVRVESEVGLVDPLTRCPVKV